MWKWQEIDHFKITYQNTSVIFFLISGLFLELEKRRFVNYVIILIDHYSRSWSQLKKKLAVLDLRSFKETKKKDENIAELAMH